MWYFVSSWPKFCFARYGSTAATQTHLSAARAPKISNMFVVQIGDVFMKFSSELYKVVFRCSCTPDKPSRQAQNSGSPDLASKQMLDSGVFSLRPLGPGSERLRPTNSFPNCGLLWHAIKSAFVWPVPACRVGWLSADAVGTTKRIL